MTIRFDVEKHGCLRSRFNHAVKRLLSLRGTPHQIALGFAVGIFVGMSPFMMCHSVTAIFFASLLGCNRISAVGGVFITNPVTAPFFYGWTYQVGRTFLGMKPAPPVSLEFSMDFILSLLRGAPEMLWILTVGGVATGLPMAVLCYFLCRWCIRRYRNGKTTHPPDA